jgi:predicted MFS family arabinose efflux permease
MTQGSGEDGKRKGARCGDRPAADRIGRVSSPDPRLALPHRLRGLPALISAQVSLHSGITGMRLVGPLMLLQADAPTWQVGVLIACFGIGPLLVAWRVGRYVDTHGYAPPMNLAIGLALVATALACLSSFAGDPLRLAGLCTAAAIGGAAGSTGLITLQRTVARLARDGAALRSNFAWAGLAPSASNVSGPVAAGILLDAAGPTVALLAMSVFPLLGWGISRFARPPRAPAAGTAVRSARLIDLIRHPTVRRMMLIDLLATGGWDAHAFFLPMLGHERGLSATAIGTIFGMFAAGVVAVRSAIPWVAHRLNEAGTLTVSVVATGVLFALYPFTGSAAFMGACSLALGMAIGMAQPMILSTMHQAVDEHQRGGVIALRTIWSHGHAVALPVVFASSAAVVGSSVVLWVLAGLIASGAAVTRPGPREDR